jgi:hypothetical protein
MYFQWTLPALLYLRRICLAYMGWKMKTVEGDLLPEQSIRFRLHGRLRKTIIASKNRYILDRGVKILGASNSMRDLRPKATVHFWST